jgi:anti-sigma regulatory factor (Ser/Thr protein kinase)
VPAALVMATTRSILRGSARRLVSPGPVLERTNELLCPEIPPKMFVTCLYALLDPASGRMHYANAGHDTPYWRSSAGVEELRATGMPLGLMPNMRYEEHEIVLAPGAGVLFYSDGLVEAHNARREMFGFPRLQAFIAGHVEGPGPAMITALLADLVAFVGGEAEQEDDITLVTLQRLAGPQPAAHAPGALGAGASAAAGQEQWRTLAAWSLPSGPGNERLAMESVAQIARRLNLAERRLERLKTAVAEAAMNAMEHGNKYHVDIPVTVEVRASAQALAVRISDSGGGPPSQSAETPDLAAKLAGRQSPRGWGLFLIEKLVDEMRVTSDDQCHTIELVMHLGGDTDADEAT